MCSNKTLQLFRRFCGTFKRAMKVETSDVQYGIWHLKQHNIWITASTSPQVHSQPNALNANFHFIADWNYRPQSWSVWLHRWFRGHRGHIMDVAEVTSRAAVATCALDRKVKLWDLCAGRKLGTFKPAHITGVRTLNYTPDFGSLLISTAYESAIKVWLPELSIGRAYAGSLEGHKSSVVAARLVKNSPYLVSVDDRVHLRVWDVRKLVCVQSISQPYRRSTCIGLCIMSKLQRIVVFGKTLLVFDTTIEKLGRREMEIVEDAYPLKAEFNERTKQLVVVTKADVRMYDGRSGKLLRVMSQFGRKDRVVEISAFGVEATWRRFYVGCSDGSLKAYNFNGMLVKQMEGGTAKLGSKLSERSISGIEYVQQDKILLTSSFDSTINVYDESSPEIPFRLRKLKGGHADSPITCMRYSDHLSLIATGSANGQITLWDYEMSRIEGICLGHTKEILTLEFLTPYPLLLSSSMDGAMYLWGVRGAGLKVPGVCLAGFLNVHTEGSDCYSLAVTSALVVHGGKLPKCASPYEAMTEAELKDSYLKSIGELGVRGKRPKSGEKRFIEAKKILHPPKAKDGLDDSLKRVYAIMGDEKGRMRILNLRKVVRFLLVPPVKKYRNENDHSFNPKRKEDCDLTLRVASELSKRPATGRRQQSKSAPFILSELCILTHEWTAHGDQVCAVSKIAKPEGFVTSSLDKHVKLWSREGVLWGDLDVCGADPALLWNFAYDWSGEREREKEEVIEVLKAIEPGLKYDKSEIRYDITECKEKEEDKKEHWDELIVRRMGKRVPVNVEHMGGKVPAKVAVSLAAK